MDNTTDAIEVFDSLAREYEKKFMADNRHSNSYDLFCGLVKIYGANILELSCGPGNITRNILNKRPDFEVLATDLAPNMLELARKNSPNARFKLLDTRSVGQLEDMYDGVVCGFGLPYLSKEEAVQFVSGVSGILKEGGYFYWSTMEAEAKRSGFQPSSSGKYSMYIHYHQADYLFQALRENGMEIVFLSRREIIGEENHPIPAKDLVVICRKMS